MKEDIISDGNLTSVYQSKDPTNTDRIMKLFGPNFF